MIILLYLLVGIVIIQLTLGMLPPVSRGLAYFLLAAAFSQLVFGPSKKP